MPGIIEHALRYAAMGWAVFPCKGKAPLTVHGYKDAQKDLEVVKKLFAAHPDANIGVATGKISGFFCLDVDVKGDAPGMESLADLQLANGPLPDTISARTWSGGGHFLFQLPAFPVKSRTGLRPGIDIKGEGGYIVVAPSKFNDRPYQWDKGAAPGGDRGMAAAPGWFLAILQEPAEVQKAGQDTVFRLPPGDIPKGKQDDTLFRFACSLKKQGFTAEQVRGALIEALKKCPQDPREPFTEADIQRWIGRAFNYPDAPRPISAEIDVIRTKNKSPVCNLENACRILEGEPQFKDVIWYDAFYDRIFITWRCEKKQFEDTDIERLQRFFQGEAGLVTVSDRTVRGAVILFAKAHPKNEPKDWIDSLEWDQVNRVDSFFVEYFGCSNNEYARAVSRNFWIGMIARLYRPGCQNDHMVVLEGPQGIGKTQGLRSIGGDWYGEVVENVMTKDFFLSLRGKLLVEIAELDSFSRAEATRIKQVISAMVDRYRDPYGHFIKDNARQCVFVGTTNDEHYLKDSTGGRRFWPLTCGIIDRDGIAAVRDQCFAEAAVAYKQGKAWYQVPTQQALEEQESRRISDPWQEVIWKFVLDKARVTLVEVALDCLAIEIGQVHSGSIRRIAQCLRRCGWKPLKVREGDNTMRYWVPGDLPDVGHEGLSFGPGARPF